jgi:hypothetical protein
MLTNHGATGSRKYWGPLLCVGVALTGEVATFVLAALIFILAAHRAYYRQWLEVRSLAFDFVGMITAICAQYVNFRLAIFDPALAQRVGVQIPGSRQIWDSFAAFQASVLNLFTSAGLGNLWKSGIVVDWTVAAAISIAGFLTTYVIFSLSDRGKGTTRLALLIAILYLMSCVPAVYVAAQAHVTNYPPRYLHLSGLLGIVFLCLMATIPTGILRKVLLSLILGFSALGAVVTYAVKVPTVESSEADLRVRIIALHPVRVLIVPTPSDAEGYMNPYLLQPATSSFTGWWALENYCPLTMGVPCVRGLPRPGDVVVRQLAYREGYLTESSVTEYR